MKMTLGLRHVRNPRHHTPKTTCEAQYQHARTQVAEHLIHKDQWPIAREVRLESRLLATDLAQDFQRPNRWAPSNPRHTLTLADGLPLPVKVSLLTQQPTASKAKASRAHPWEASFPEMTSTADPPARSSMPAVTLRRGDHPDRLLVVRAFHPLEWIPVWLQHDPCPKSRHR
jgi:hypothetical protein